MFEEGGLCEESFDIGSLDSVIFDSFEDFG